MPRTLDPDVVDALASVGIYQPDPADPVHVRLVEALERTIGQPDGVRLTAMRWVYAWALEREGDELAEARASYEALLASHIVRFRDDGEKSGEMCTKRAEARDDVKAANLRYRLAEQRERLARKRLDACADQIKVWSSLNANERAANLVHARTGV